MRIRSDLILKAKDGSNRGRPSRLRQKEIQDIVNSYSTHESKELAARYGCTYEYICRIWREHGLPKKSHRWYSLNEKYFESIDAPDKAYFLGLIAADGAVVKTVRGPMVLRLKLSIEDEYILRKFLDCIGSDAPINYVNHLTAQNKVPRMAAYLSITSQKICADLALYNVIPRKTWSYIPVPLNAEMMPHFVRGYFDGDGTIYKLRKSFKGRLTDYRVAVVGNEQAMVFVQRYLETRDIETAVVKSEREGKLFRLEMRTAKAKLGFIRLLYTNTHGLCLTRKRILADEFVALAACNGENHGE